MEIAKIVWNLFEFVGILSIGPVWADVTASRVGSCQGPAALAKAIHAGTQRGSPLETHLCITEYCITDTTHAW